VFFLFSPSSCQLELLYLVMNVCEKTLPSLLPPALASLMLCGLPVLVKVVLSLVLCLLRSPSLIAERGSRRARTEVPKSSFLLLRRARAEEQLSVTPELSCKGRYGWVRRGCWERPTLSVLLMLGLACVSKPPDSRAVTLTPFHVNSFWKQTDSCLLQQFPHLKPNSQLR